MRQVWLFPFNPKLYDLDEAFRHLQAIDWHQSVTSIAVGDIVLIYVSKTERRIKYKCMVRVVNKPEPTIDDSSFVLDGKFDLDYGCYCELALVAQYYSDQLHYDALVANGLKSVQGPNRLSPELVSYLDQWV